MAEKSFPFGEANASGGQTAVSQLDWQDMAKLWGGDRVDFKLTNYSYQGGALPFSARVVNARTIEIKPGSAWVGGFYYQLDSILTLDIESNPTENPRRDTIVVRVDLAKGSANLAAVKGQPSKAPIAPRPQRIAGRTWEMVLIEVLVPAKDGALVLTGVAPYDMPASVSSPWNTRQTADYHPMGTFSYDLDSNGTDTQYEAFNGRDGYMVTRHLGKARSYTPKLVNTGKLPSGVQYRGLWRWIAPNSVWFSIDINNTSNTDIKQSGSGPISFTLPQNPSSDIGHAFSGYMLNSGYDAGLPNFVSLTGMSWSGNKTNVAKILYPSPKKLHEGLDYLLVFPRKSSIVLTGVYEANTL
ncbi:hypothetical protein RCO28_12510 [Streptomyces sp. LHD-70]|uniref:hypothetical protein n=1 Tax=Streptomyces sp. LHD-70 TaxID=3072140 RepID=UPI00280C5703|nr:hypothetical protein [Streptomyces sp. LHD-70]MDQ8703304.1 hypothetical protein [Streptomyces sp. LHD-70]